MMTHGVQFGTAGAQAAYAAAPPAVQPLPKASAAAVPRADAAEFSDRAVRAAMKDAGNGRHAATALLAKVFSDAAAMATDGGTAGTGPPGSVLARYLPAPDMTTLYLAA